MTRWLLLGGLVAIAAAAPAAPAPPCSAAEARQFDFWLGEWNASWPAVGGNPAGTATNHVTQVLGGCAIEENFVGQGAQPLVGRSLSVYSPSLGRWQQTWVDNQGSYLDFVGAFQEGTMTLSRSATAPDGRPLLQRMVFLNIQRDAFDWRWEASKDGGKTWTLQWPIRYVRRAGAKPAP